MRSQLTASSPHEIKLAFVIFVPQQASGYGYSGKTLKHGATKSCSLLSLALFDNHKK